MNTFTSYLYLIGRLALMGVVLYYFKWAGFYAIIIYFVLLGIIASWQSRDKIIMIKEYTESVIWGKPLRMFTGKELRNTKVKIVWGKDKNDVK